jgi:hypothetical protein
MSQELKCDTEGAKKGARITDLFLEELCFFRIFRLEKNSFHSNMHFQQSSKICKGCGKEKLL